MTPRPFILFPDATSRRWRIGSADRRGEPTFSEFELAADVDPGNAARALVAPALARMGYAGEPALLAVPSEWCLASAVEMGPLDPTDRKALLYRLEENLPLAAEGVVADFVATGRGSTHALFAACVQILLVQPVVASLEAAGVTVQSIVPAALLAAQSVARVANGGALVAIGEGDAKVSLVVLEQGVPRAWSVAAARAEDVRLHLDLLRLADVVPEGEAVACGVTKELADALADVLREKVRTHDAPVDREATRAGAAVLQGRLQPWAEFRRDALAARDKLRRHRRALDSMLAAAAALCIAIAIVAIVRAQRYAARTKSYDAQLVDEFSRAFPGWQVPTNVRAVIASEHRKAELAARGAGATDRNGAGRGNGIGDASALRTMGDLLTHLPTDARFAMQTMAFRGDTFEYSGRLRAYEDGERLTVAAREAGFEVTPVSARREEDGTWSFTLRGERAVRTATAGDRHR